MRLRPRQKTFVERSLAALASRGNTLGLAPTGAGKTIMLSAVTGEMIGDGAKACVLAHRDELTAQNRAKFQRVVPGVATSVIDATEKSWGGQVAFAMVPTLARASNLADMPRLDLLVIDEAHHAVADSYRRIIERVREANPDARLFGVTATPNRGDKKGLREIFDNVADQVRLGELIASGHLVPPRTFVIDVGVQDELRSVRKTMSDFDMTEVAGIMNRALQFEFTATPKDEGQDFSGQSLRIFAIGHALEDLAVAWLRGAGFDLYTRRGNRPDGGQFGFSVAGGRIRGHVDGIIAAGPEGFGLASHDTGPLIRSKAGFWLAIPMPAAGKSLRGSRITPGEWERRTGMRLRFVYRRTSPSLLVADNVRVSKSGRVRENITRHKDGRVSSRLLGRATAVMFLLVPQVKLPKRLDLARDARAVENALPGLIVANWGENSS